MTMRRLAQKAVSVYQEEGMQTVLRNIPTAILTRSHGYFNRSDIVTDGDILVPSSESISNNEIGRIHFGWHEQSERLAIQKYLPTDIPVIELGAGIGYISSYIDETLQEEEHLAVEANENLWSALELTRELNSASYKIIKKAYHPNSSSVSLSNSTDYSEQSVLERSGGIRTVSLKDLVNKYDLDKFALVADIEGAERLIIEEEIELLRKHCPWIIVEWHGTISEDVLLKSGFEKVSEIDEVYIFLNKELKYMI
ncbi:FkbM family methyltransferase [Haloterrigena alkaliphila]|uniref:FkbM family methyltransferase n=1 Tax=Haloterrigena alkaliphila TaxID=2816475 RepID=A0A8A2VBY6_9EURY|nr:FkbM family methyltransferase [Haloterrigena alkaliphila]QSW98227.1 FkbM family methyltransferase [Haloterrigena alkaliphila]